MAAAMYITKSAIFNLSKAQTPSALTFHRKVSRVCFTSASKFSQGRNAEEESRGGYKKGCRAKESDGDSEDIASQISQKAKEMKEKTSEATTEKSNEATEKAKEQAQGAKDAAGKAADKTKDAAGTVAEKAKEGTEKAAETAEYTKEKAKEDTHVVTEKVKEAAETVADKAKQTVQGAWGAAKGTTQKIKETVVGKSDDVDDYVEDHVRKPAKEDGEKTMDELRRRAGDGDEKKD